jgi:two-component system KDP operon response regulator KdpE
MPHEGAILVVDDEVEIRRFLRISLMAHGYQVIEASRGAAAIAAVSRDRPSLVILDLGLPDRDGVDVIRDLREWSAVPVLVLSVREDEKQKVAALEAGANDYVTKPFGIAELIARVRVLLRRRDRDGDAPDEPVFREHGLTVNFASRQVFLNGDEIHLTRKEFDLLRLLARHAGTILTHETLLGEVWGPAHVSETHYLRIHIARLRQKLGDDPNVPRFIWTEPGVGYRLITE